jgi:hypothetical protein
MSTMTAKEKTELGNLLVKGHSQFGPVAPRKPYKEDDAEGGGEGAASFSPFEEHPLLKKQPIGASSDLTSRVTENIYAEAETEKRSEDLTLEMQQKLALQQANRHRKTAVPNLSPYGT